MSHFAAPDVAGYDDWDEPWQRTWARRGLVTLMGILVTLACLSGWGLSRMYEASGSQSAAEHRTSAVHEAATPPAPDPAPLTTADPSASSDGPTLTPATTPAGEPEPPVGSGPRPSAEWLERTAARTGIPKRALLAYASAVLVVGLEQPECGIGWNTLAGIGWVESKHGSHGGSTLDENGYPSPAIRGIALDGNGVAAISDTDGGAWDGDQVWDRAVGPMQFIPSTWASWGADGNGDATADPNQIDDVALAAARYLCHSGSMSAPQGWRDAIFSYNHLHSYVDSVAAKANEYAGQAAR